MDTTTPESKTPCAHPHHFRFHAPHLHLNSLFGGDWFALKAKRSRGSSAPRFSWWRRRGGDHLDRSERGRLLELRLYPFILLNLAFSLQAAYAAPLILLAQTRQADRDKAHAEADAQHREELAQSAADRQALAAEQTAQLLELMSQNTKLTELTQQLSQRIEALTEEIHGKLGPPAATGNNPHRRRMLEFSNAERRDLKRRRNGWRRRSTSAGKGRAGVPRRAQRGALAPRTGQSKVRGVQGGEEDARARDRGTEPQRADRPRGPRGGVLPPARRARLNRAANARKAGQSFRVSRRARCRKRVPRWIGSSRRRWDNSRRSRHFRVCARSRRAAWLRILGSAGFQAAGRGILPRPSRRKRSVAAPPLTASSHRAGGSAVPRSSTRRARSAKAPTPGRAGKSLPRAPPRSAKTSAAASRMGRKSPAHARAKRQTRARRPSAPRPSPPSSRGPAVRPRAPAAASSTASS